MSATSATDRRAQRLLRLYPLAWRERYGDEFIDFMEQSIADNPRNFKRTANVLLKSFVARLGDVGIVTPAMDESTLARAKLGTTALFATVFSVFSLFYWSYAMIAWNAGPSPSSTSVSLWTGAITVFAILLTVTLALIAVSLIVRSCKRLLWNRDRGLLLPLVLVTGSAVALGNDVHQFTRLIISRGGIDWAHPGWAIKQIAGATLSSSTITIWGPSETLGHFFSKLGILYSSAPLAVLVFAFGLAILIRREQSLLRATWPVRAAARALSLEMILFLASYIGWFVAGGAKTLDLVGLQPFTEMEHSLFVAITVIALLAIKTSLGLRQPRNHIEVLRSKNDLP